MLIRSPLLCVGLLTFFRLKVSNKPSALNPGEPQRFVELIQPYMSNVELSGKIHLRYKRNHPYYRFSVTRDYYTYIQLQFYSIRCIAISAEASIHLIEKEVTRLL